MTSVETLVPIKIDPKVAIKCDLLCNLKCVYSKGNISYVFDEKGRVHFEYKSDASVDVYFNNIPYVLKTIYIGARRHKTFPNDPTIVGECTLYHSGGKNQESLLYCLFFYEQHVVLVILKISFLNF